MTHKLTSMVNRHTWSLDRFEFSVSRPYEECLTRLRTLETNLQADFDRHATAKRRGQRPFLSFESNNDATSFKLALQNVIVTGTVQQATDKTTLFVGLSQISSDFYIVIIWFLVVALALAILPFLSAYVMANPNYGWSTDRINAYLPLIKMSLATIGFLYLLFRWQVWRAMNTLVSAINY